MCPNSGHIATWFHEADGWETISTEGVSVSVTAYAIRADGFDDPLKSKEENVADAWAALAGKDGRTNLIDRKGQRP